MLDKRDKKYRKLLYFPESTMKVIDRMAEKPVRWKKKYKHQYRYNSISKFYPFAHSLPDRIENNLLLPTSHYTYGQTWGALKKAWLSYRVAKCRNEGEDRMKICAHKIQKLEKELGIPTASFPNLGIIGDIFFLYDKEKERELRRIYAEQNIICDNFSGPDNIGFLDDDTLVNINARKLALKKYYEAFNEFMKKNETKSKQEENATTVRRWEKREKLKMEVESIEEELVEIKKVIKSGPERYKRLVELKQQRDLKVAELENVSAVQIFLTDQGMKYTEDVLNETP